MAKAKRGPRAQSTHRAEAAAPPVANEHPDNLPAVIEPQPLEPDIGPPEEREWRTLSEVEQMVPANRMAIRQMVADGMIPGMEPGKQGTPQKWLPYHIERLRFILRAQSESRSLSDLGKVAEAVNMDPARLDERRTCITPKGLRIISDHDTVASLARITRGPILIVPKP